VDEVGSSFAIMIRWWLSGAEVHYKQRVIEAKGKFALRKYHFKAKSNFLGGSIPGWSLRTE
jgi:hypothetical protein